MVPVGQYRQTHNYSLISLLSVIPVSSRSNACPASLLYGSCMGQLCIHPFSQLPALWCPYVAVQAFRSLQMVRSTHGFWLGKVLMVTFGTILSTNFPTNPKTAPISVYVSWSELHLNTSQSASNSGHHAAQTARLLPTAAFWRLQINIFFDTVLP